MKTFYALEIERTEIKYFYYCQSVLSSYRPRDTITISFSGKNKNKWGEEVGQKQMKIKGEI